MMDWIIRILTAVNLSLFLVIPFANAGSGGQNDKAQPVYREFKPLSENLLQEAGGCSGCRGYETAEM